jgi:hypothetical protein
MVCSSCALLLKSVAFWCYCDKNNGLSSVMAFSSLQQLHRDAKTSAESGALNIAHISAISCHLSLFCLGYKATPLVLHHDRVSRDLHCTSYPVEISSDHTILLHAFPDKAVSRLNQVLPALLDVCVPAPRLAYGPLHPFCWCRSLLHELNVVATESKISL